MDSELIIQIFATNSTKKEQNLYQKVDLNAIFALYL